MTLTAVDDMSFTLRVEVVVEIAGKRITSEPKSVKWLCPS